MTQPLTFVILSTGPETAQELRSALSADRRVRVLASSDRAEQVYAEIVRARPSAVILTIDRQPESAWALCHRIRAVSPQTVIICALRDSSPDLILESLRVGAREFLRLPLNAAELATVLDRTVEFCAGESTTTKKLGRTVAVFSSKGGCGTSFIAANLAIALNAPTVLVDLNLQAGDQDIFFGLRPKFSITDVIANLQRLDEGLLANYLSPHSGLLAVLAAPRNADAAEDIKPEQVAEVLRVLRERHDYVVLDLPHTLDATTLTALDQADDILLVLTLDILAGRSAQRALSIFTQLGYPRQKIHLIINRLTKQRDLELQHIERYLGERITALVSNDPTAANNSVNQGQPLLGSGSASPIVAEIRRLAVLCGAPEPEPEAEARKGLLGSLFRRQTNTTPLAGFPVLPGKDPVGAEGE